MASSSNLLRLLPPLALLAGALLPFTSCHNSNAAHAVNKCGGIVSTTDLPNHMYGNKVLISGLLNPAPANGGFAYAYHISSVFGLAWCRADFSAARCSACLAKAAKNLVGVCSSGFLSGRVVFQDFCYIRLDMDDFLPKLDLSFSRILPDKRQISAKHRSAYRVSVGGLLTELKQAVPEEKKWFARRKVKFHLENAEIYGVGQCVQGILRESCAFCLEQASRYIMALCMHGRRCEIFFGSCFLQYYTKTIKR